MGAFAPVSASSGANAAPLPPLPPLQTSAPGPGGDPASSPMASIMSGLAPVKQKVDIILQTAKELQQLGIIPGSEGPIGQIIALATSLLPMAAQAAMQSAGPTAGPIGAGGPPGMSPMPPPPGAPPQLGGM